MSENSSKSAQNKKLRNGFTTGSCAASACRAAALALLMGETPLVVRIITPKGEPYEPEIEDLRKMDGAVSCAVRKDGGDDIDATHGMPVYAIVSTRPDHPAFTSAHDWENVQFPKKEAAAGSAAPRRIFIDGGTGVGRVTKPGLDQPVGNAAINHVPREMITGELEDVMERAGYTGSLFAEIWLPEGERIAKKTFNPRFGIEGGLSILGTSGVVEPMSEKALIDTIRVELRQKSVLDPEKVVVSPGNYGQDFMLRTYGYDLDESVKCSNFIGLTMEMCAQLGFKKVLLVGHAGKLIKVAGGIMNTHSREADCRMEVTAACALRAGADAGLCRKILDCVSTEEAIRILEEAGLCREAMAVAMKKIQENLQRRAGDDMSVDCMMYTNDAGLLAATKGASEWFTL